MIVSCILSGTQSRKRNFDYNYSSNSNQYIGPSSYTTSSLNDYPSYGNYGSLLNTQNPQFASSYSVYGGENANSQNFGSTSYTNYPSQVQDQSLSSVTSNWPSHLSNFINSPPTYSNTESTATPISQHIETYKPIVVPIHKKFPYPVSKKFPVAIPHPVLVPYPAPYPVS